MGTLFNSTLIGGVLQGGVLNTGLPYTSLLAQLSAVGTFTRASTGKYFDSDSVMQSAAINVARYGYKPSTVSFLGLLMESSRTNLFKYSEDFTNAVWTKTQVTVDDDSAVAPDGNTTMDLIIKSVASSNNFTYNATSITSGQTYTQSMFVKAGGYNFIQITGSTGFGTTYANFDLTDGSIGNTNGGVATIEDIGGGIYRITYTIAATSTTTGRMLMSVLNADTAARLPSFAGDGTSGVYFWGAQLENAPIKSSYIATTASAATRALDVANTPFTLGAQVSLVGEFTMPTPNGSGTQAIFRADDGGSANEMVLLKATGTSGQITAEIIHGGVTIFSATKSGLTLGSQVKVALLFEQGDIALVVDGVVITPTTDTGGALPTGIDVIGLGCSPAGVQQLDEHSKVLNHYETRLTDAQGIVLTT